MLAYSYSGERVPLIEKKVRVFRGMAYLNTLGIHLGN